MKAKLDSIMSEGPLLLGGPFFGRGELRVHLVVFLEDFMSLLDPGSGAGKFLLHRLR